MRLAWIGFIGLLLGSVWLVDPKVSETRLNGFPCTVSRFTFNRFLILVLFFPDLFFGFARFVLRCFLIRFWAFLDSFWTVSRFVFERFLIHRNAPFPDSAGRFPIRARLFPDSSVARFPIHLVPFPNAPDTHQTLGSLGQGVGESERESERGRESQGEPEGERERRGEQDRGRGRERGEMGSANADRGRVAKMATRRLEDRCKSGGKERSWFHTAKPDGLHPTP